MERRTAFFPVTVLAALLTASPAGGGAESLRSDPVKETAVLAATKPTPAAIPFNKDEVPIAVTIAPETGGGAGGAAGGERGGGLPRGKGAPTVPTAKQTALVAAPSAKVRALLELIGRPASPATLRHKLEQAHLTKAEASELASELRKPEYGAALQESRRNAAAEGMFGPPPGTAPSGPAVQDVRLAVRREHEDLLARLLAEVQQSLPPARAAATRPGPPAASGAPTPLAVGSAGARPVIETISPRQLTPGVRFVARGRNLASGDRPTVRLEDTGRGWRFQCELQVLGHDEDHVEAFVPDDTSGVPSGPVTLALENGFGIGRLPGVDFVAAEEVVTFTGEPLKACCSSLIDEGYSTPGGAAISGLTDCPDVVLCLWGRKVAGRPFANLPAPDGSALGPLGNGWTVAAVTVDTVRDGSGAGCSFENAPAPGATDFRATVLVAWANGFCGAACTPKLAIRGPRGVRYH